MVDCNKCKHLNITEKEQTDKKEDHICLKYGRRVLHHNFFGEKSTEILYPCTKCCNDNYKNYEVRYEDMNMDYKEMWVCLRTKVLEDLIDLKTGQTDEKDIATLQYINDTMKKYESAMESN